MVTQTYATARWQQPPTHTHTQWMGLITAWLFCVLGINEERLVVCQGRQWLPRLIKAWLGLRGEAGVEKIPVDGSGLTDEEGTSLHKHAISSVLAWDAIIVLLSCRWKFSFVCECHVCTDQNKSHPCHLQKEHLPGPGSNINLKKWL